MGKCKLFLLVAVAAGAIYGGWWLSQPVEIIGVHYNGNHSYVLVRHFPLTDRGKIAWWQNNKIQLKEKYGIPQPDERGSFTIVIWDFVEGYKEMPDNDQGSDLLCFEDMKMKANCIEKEKILSVTRSSTGKITFGIDRAFYRQDKEGDEIKRIKRN